MPDANIVSRFLRYWPYYRSFGFKGRRIAQALFPRHPEAGRSPQSLIIPGLTAPITLRPGTMDASVFYEVFVQKLYDKKLPFVPKRIVDAGANVGCASLYFHRHYPQAQIVALEAEAANFLLLQENVRPYPGIRPLHAALWHRQTHLNLMDQAANSSSFRFSEAPQESGVSALSPGEILRLAQWEEIDLFKINVEGAEKALFSNQPIDWVQRVRVFMMDLHDRFLPGCTDAVMRVLQPLGYRYAKKNDIHFFSRP